MSEDTQTSADVKAKKTWLMFPRRQKISNCDPRAAPQQAEEHRDSCAVPGAQAAAAESRAAAPHGPRARGLALLRSLRRRSRAILGRVRAVIRRQGQQPGTLQHLPQGMQAVTGAAAHRAGAESRAAAPHSPCCPTSPSPGQLEAVAGQGTGAAVGAVLKPTEQDNKAWFSLEPDGDEDSLEELALVGYDPEEGCSGEQRPSERPCKAWVEHGNLPLGTATGQAPALPSTAPHSWAQVSSSESVLAPLPPCPSPSQEEAQRQWAIAAAQIILQGLLSEDGDTPEDVQAGSSRDESDCMSYYSEPGHLEPCKGTGLLELSPQTRDQSAAKGEDRSPGGLAEEKCNVITIRTVWVNPRYPQLLVDPDSLGEEEAEADLRSTSGALAAPRDTQAAAAALAGAPEGQEHPVHATAWTAEVAKAAASAVPGTQAAAAESRAAAPHGPRARGQALLRSLRRRSRAILGRVRAVIR